MFFSFRNGFLFRDRLHSGRTIKWKNIGCRWQNYFGLHLYCVLIPGSKFLINYCDINFSWLGLELCSCLGLWSRVVLESLRLSMATCFTEKSHSFISFSLSILTVWHKHNGNPFYLLPTPTLIIMLYWFRHRAESRIPNPNNKDKFNLSHY